MDDSVERIIVIGGGTAGWLSAVFLAKALDAGPGRCSITLVESSDIGTIGVGEATVPSLKNTFAFCGVDEADWMRRCNASFKNAIKFVDWAGPGRVFWHPFGPQPSVGGLPLGHHWLRRRLQDGAPPYAKACFPAVELCESKRAPKTDSDEPYQGQVDYAYHLDAGLLATYLKQLGKSRGVRHVVDTVEHVVQAPDGKIDHVVTGRNGNVHGDLFIDCSGFRGLLINQTLGEPFIPFSDVLLCDRAIAMPIPTDDRRLGIEPYTTSTALSAGWAWRTPLYGRSGNGYVYSSAFISKDDAEREFRRYLGPAAAAVQARHLSMRVGRTRNAWVRNCVSIGLSSGFIEPLESTGIWFIELALYNLLYHFPTKDCDERVAAHFNEVMRVNYEQVRDFITLHYCTTKRNDTPFWRANRNHAALPESLRRGLDLWRSALPAYDRFVDPGFFKDYSFVCILDGMGWLPARSFPLLDHRDGADGEAALRAIRERSERLVRLLPDHYAYLAHLHADMPEALPR